MRKKEKKLKYENQPNKFSLIDMFSRKSAMTFMFVKKITKTMNEIKKKINTSVNKITKA